MLTRAAAVTPAITALANRCWVTKITAVITVKTAPMMAMKATPKTTRIH
jgi:hypothetical protein